MDALKIWLRNTHDVVYTIDAYWLILKYIKYNELSYNVIKSLSGINIALTSNHGVNIHVQYKTCESMGYIVYDV